MVSDPRLRDGQPQHPHAEPGQDDRQLWPSDSPTSCLPACGGGVSALSALLDVHVLPSGGGTVTAATGAPTHPTGTTPSGDRHTPGDLLDLSRWYLTLPIADPSGRDDSGPWDVYQAELRTFNHRNISGSSATPSNTPRR